MQDNKRYNNPVRYSLAMFGISMLGYMYGAYYIPFYNIDLGLPLSAIAVGNIFFAIWDAFNDPISGYLSDRTRTKWGRRKPWLLVSVSILMLSSYLFFSPPKSLIAEHGVKLAVYFTIFLMLAETANTIASVNYHSLLPELFRDEKQRNKANSIRQALQLVGMIVGVSLVPMIAGSIGYGNTALILAVIGGALTIYSILGCREQKEFSEMPQPKFIPSLLEIAKNRNFWFVTLSHFCYGAATDLLLPAMTFYVLYALKTDRGNVTILTAMVFVTAIPFMILWNKLINKFGAVKAWRAALIWLGLALIPFYFANTLVVAAIVGVFVGIGIAGVTANLDMINSKLIEEDAARYGVRREATYFAVMSFIRRWSSLVRTGVLFLMVAWFGFVSGDEPGLNPDGAARFMMVLVPVAMMALSVFFSFLAKFKETDETSQAAITQENQ